MNKTLLIMAAGMGSRYGGLKQIDTVGPHAQVLLDYSIYDAKRSGCNKVVFVIRESFADAFKKKFNQNRYGSDLQIHYVYQELSSLIGNFKTNPARTKPWGTGHAVLVAKNVIHEPFLINNADDFYGLDAFSVASKYLDKMIGKEKKYCTIGYQLSTTLSTNGTVARGIFTKSRGQNLINIEEHLNIKKTGRKITGQNSQGETVILPGKTLVGVNIYGCTPDYFTYTTDYWHEFLRQHAMDEKTEFFLPTTIDNLINREKASVKILPTTAKWLGVTYKEDKAVVTENIAKLTKAGVYPEKLWV
jgi:dTDP-glucose pyrophosphorylase